MISIAFVAAAVLTLKFPLAEVLEDTRKASLCGVYASNRPAALYKTIKFDGGVDALLDASLGDNPQPHFVHKGRLFTLADTALHELKVKDDKTLVGVDEFTAKDTFKRAKAPKKACPKFAGDKAAETKVEGLLCYLHGVDLQAAQKTKEAYDQYESCCKAGSAVSCNKQGFLLGMFGKDAKQTLKLFTKACDMGYGGGCSNAGDVVLKEGKKADALKLYKRGCALKFNRSCAREAEVELDL